MIIIASLQLTIAPLPQHQTFKDEVFPLIGSPIVRCKYLSNQEQCNDYVMDNVNFYLSKIFARDQGYNYNEYEKLGYKDIINTINILIVSNMEHRNVLNTSEAYDINISSTQISITADSSFGIARAFASLIQLVDSHPNNRSDRRAYGVQAANITDINVFKWREVEIDIARNMQSISQIKHQIDAAAVAKFNVMHIHAQDTETFAIMFNNILNKSVYSEKVALSLAEVKELIQYGHSRGVFVYFGLELPAHAAAFGRTDANLVAKCPNAIKNNKNSQMLNLLNDNVYTLIKEAVLDLVQQYDINEQIQLQPIIHLGGLDLNTQCWEEDPDIKKYINDNKLNAKDLLKLFYKKLTTQLNETLQQKYIQFVFADEASNNNVQLAPSAIIHFINSNNKMDAIKQGYRVISSFGWQLDVMNYGRWRYCWQDTWQDIYQTHPENGITEMDNFLGGGVIMWGDLSWGYSMDQLLYPRALPVSEILWINPPTRPTSGEVVKRFEMFSCKMHQAGVLSGPMDPGAPCFGYNE